MDVRFNIFTTINSTAGNCSVPEASTLLVSSTMLHASDIGFKSRPSSLHSLRRYVYVTSRLHKGCVPIVPR